jgi:eukaryotic-like serine/threonine-protein kinase
MQVKHIALGILAATLIAACGSSPASTAPGASSIRVVPVPSLAKPASGDVTTYRGDVARTGAMPGPGPVGSPAIAWRFKANEPMESSVAVVGHLIYLVTLQGSVIALDRSTGAERWKVALGQTVRSSPTVANGLVILGTATGVTALDARSGAPVWSRGDLGPVLGSPGLAGSFLIAASTTGTVTALEVGTGATDWSRQVGAPVTRSVASDNGTAIVGLDGGSVVALRVADGSIAWRDDTDIGGSIGTPAIAAGRAFLATGLDGVVGADHHLLALDVSSGHELWRYTSPDDSAVYTPAFGGGWAIVVSEDATIVGLDPASGAAGWRLKAPGPIEALPAVVDGTFYVASNGGFVLAVRATSGTELWRTAIRGVPYAPVVVDGRVLVTTNLGEVDAIGGSAR